MTTSDLAERLTALGRHLDDERQARSTTGSGHGSGPAAVEPGTPDVVDLQSVRSGPSTPVLAIAVALVAALAAGAIAISGLDRGGGDEIAVSTPGQRPPLPVPAGAPAPGTVAAYVDDPPGWFGEPVAGFREGQLRTGRWVAAAVGVRFGDTVMSPVLIGVTDGTTTALDGAETIEINGWDLRSRSSGRWSTVATTDDPQLVISGGADVSQLADLLPHLDVTTGPTGFSLQIDDLPAPYSLVRPPQELADDPPLRRTFTNTTGDVSINEISDWVDPELAAAAVGVTYSQVAVGDLIAWAGTSDLNPYGPLLFLTWSPQPGVVLEITTSNPDRTIDELGELATLTRVVPIDVWDDLL